MDVPLAARGSLFAALTAFMAEGVIALDSEGRVLFVNREAERLIGWTSAELKGRQVQEVMPGLAEHWQRARRPVQRQELSFPCRDGSLLPVTCVTARLVEAGRVIGSVALFRDLRPQQRLEASQAALVRALTETQKSLIQSQKLATIGQLAAGIVHDISNPVAYVSSNLATLDCYLKKLFEVLSAYRALEAEVDERSPALSRLRALAGCAQYEFLMQDLPDLVRESAEGMSWIRRILQDLKDFSRAAPDEWQPVDLHRGLDSTINIIHHEIRRTAQVVRDYGDIPPVECLATQMNQVFMNLLINAAHSIEHRGTIMVSTTRPDPDHVCVRISDDGVGMSKEVMARVFEPFFTTKPVGKGTGLGLSLSYAIVRKHGGRIEVESEPGKGTTFRVILPVHRSQEQQASVPAY